MKSFPTIIVAYPDGKVLFRIEGYTDAATLLRKLSDRTLLQRQTIYPDPDIITTNDRKLRIPFSVNKSMERDIKEVLLLVSTDEGRNWQPMCSCSPSESGFVFDAPSNGLYWFDVQVVRKDGRTEPSIVDGRVRPSLKIRIDTDFKNGKKEE